MQHCDRINRKVQRKVLAGLPQFILYIAQETLYVFTCYMYMLQLEKGQTKLN